MATCPKCRKQNPIEAAFCGFCGAVLAVQKPQQSIPGATAKTVFGYSMDPSALIQAGQAAASKAEKAPVPPLAKVPTKQATSGAPISLAPSVPETAPPPKPPSDKTTPYPTGQGLIASRYWLGDRIKKYAAGEIFQAKDMKQEGELDLFLVDNAVFSSPLDIERVRRELRQLQKIDCPAIVKVFDHGNAEDGRLYIAMERVKGISLDDLVARGPVSIEETQRIIRDVGTGLAEAQKLGVIHRDIAPHNILVGQSGEIKVRGFSIAAPIKRNISGTPEFLSPEQASGRPVDQRSNIYSLGALMFYLLTQEPPFKGTTPDEILDKQIKEEPVSPTRIRPDLQLPARAEALILKAMAKNSSRRHLTLRQFLREVDSLTGGSTQDAPSPSGPIQPLSFITPVHGVTALSGGTRPPSAEIPRFEMTPTGPSPAIGPPPSKMNAAFFDTIKDQDTYPAQEVTAPTPISLTPTVPPITRAGDAPSPALANTVMEPPAEALPGKMRPSQITGVLSSATSLKHSESPPPEARGSRITATPVTPAAKAGDEKKPAFRETMWFFKGEMESSIAETTAPEEVPIQRTGEETPAELTAKYSDDGSMTEDEARRLSLRTGKTQMMQQAHIPSGVVPGEKMAAEEFIGEMNWGRKIAIWGGIFLIVATLAGVVVWLFIR